MNHQLLIMLCNLCYIVLYRMHAIIALWNIYIFVEAININLFNTLFFWYIFHKLKVDLSHTVNQVLMSSCFMYIDIKWERYRIDQCRTEQNIESTSTPSIHSSSLVINRYQKYMGDIIIGNKQISEVYGRHYHWQ